MQINELPDGTFEVEFRTQHGTTGRVSLGTSSREEAVARVAAMRVSELETVSGIMGLTHQVVGQIIAGKSLTLGDAIAFWRTNISGRGVLATNTLVTNESILRTWAAFGNLHGVSLFNIGPEHVSAFINAGGERRTTALRKLGAIRNFYNFLFNEGLVLRNPAASGMVRVNYEAFSHGEKEAKSRPVFTDDDIRTLLESADHFWRACIVIARDTGLRLSDICQLEWAGVSNDAGQHAGHGATIAGTAHAVHGADAERARALLVVWTDKTNTRVELPISDDVRRAFAELPSTGIKFVFPDRCATIRDPKRRAGLSVEFGRLLRKCKLDNRGLTFHCLRHTYASRMVREGLTVEQTAANLGHRDAATTRLYIHSDPGATAHTSISCSS